MSNWMKDAADAKGLPMSKDESPRNGLRHAVRRMARKKSEGCVAAAEGGSKKQAKNIRCAAVSLSPCALRG